MKKTLSFFIIFLSVSLTVSAGDIDYAGQAQPGKWLKNIIVKTEFMGEISSAKIQIFFPTGYSKGKKLRFFWNNRRLY